MLLNLGVVICPILQKEKNVETVYVLKYSIVTPV